MYAVWRQYDCLWPGLPPLCHRTAVCRMARLLLPLAWVDSSLLSYGCTSYGASIIVFVQGQFIFAIVWLNVIWRDHYCNWPGLPHICHRMVVRRMPEIFLPLAWVTSSLPGCCCRPCGASIIAFVLGHLIFASVWVYVAWREQYCLWPGLTHFCHHTAIRRMARVLLPLA